MKVGNEVRVQDASIPITPVHDEGCRINKGNHHFQLSFVHKRDLKYLKIEPIKLCIIFIIVLHCCCYIKLTQNNSILNVGLIFQLAIYLYLI